MFTEDKVRHKSNWLVSLLICFCVICETSFAQEVKVIPEELLTINNFGGLNTRAGDFAIKANEFRILHNWDLNRNVGSLTKRFGYDSVGTVSEADSVLGIYGASFSDGRQWLVVIADSISGGAADSSGRTGYGNIYTTPFGSTNVIDSLTRRATYWGVQNPSYVKMLQDNIYIVNGQQRGIILTQEGRVRSFPLRAGGEPLVVPLKRSNGEINGEVVYAVHTNPDTGVTGIALTAEWRTAIQNKTPKQGLSLYRDGILTAPVHISSGRALITNFHTPIRDTLTYLDRVFGLIQIDSIKNSFQYWVSATGIPADSAYYTSDATATLSEIVDSLRDSINADTVGSSVGDVFGAVKAGDSTLLLYAPGAIATDFSFRTPYMGGVCFTRANLKLYRSRVNENIINRGDSADLIKTFTWNQYSPVNWDTLLIIDSVSGGSPFDALLFTDTRTGRDSTRAMTYRYGALGFLSSDSCAGAADSGGLFRGWPFSQPDTLGVYYTYTFIDTLLGIEGDTARSLFVYNRKGNGNKKSDEITLRLPIRPTSDSGVVLNLYRGAILQMTHDSGFWKMDTNIIYGGTGINEIPNLPPNTDISNPAVPRRWSDGDRHFHQYSNWLDVLIPDSTVLGTPYLVKQLPITDTIYTDTLSHKGLMTHRPYRKATPPTQLKNLEVLGDRMYASTGSRLYFSRLDSGFAWGAFDFISLDESDGDKITAIIPGRDVIKVYKNKKKYNIFQDDYLRWNRVEVAGYIGCVASQSPASGLGGDFYLSEEGVIRETEGQYRDRSFNTELASAQIKEISEYPIDVKSAAVGHYLNNRAYLLSFPTKDTTHVHFDRANAWATWGFSIGGATSYAKEVTSNYTASQFLPMDTMYFFKPGGKKIYRYGSSESDDGAVVRPLARTAPFLTDQMGIFKQINRIGLASNSTTADSVFLRIFDEKGTVVGAVTSFGLLSERYRVQGWAIAPARYYQFEFTNSSVQHWSGNTKIDQFDIWYSKHSNDITR